MLRVDALLAAAEFGTGATLFKGFDNGHRLGQLIYRFLAIGGRSVQMPS